MASTTSAFKEGAFRLAEEWPYLRYLGLGAWWAWIWLCYSSPSLFALWAPGSTVGYTGLMYLYSTPAIALACIAAALAEKRAAGFLARRGIVVAFGAVASGGTLLVVFSPWLGGDAVFGVGGVLTGIGTSVLCLKTGAVLGTVGRREVLTAGYVSLAFAAFLYFMGIGLPSPLCPVFVAALPLVSAMLYIMPGDDPYAVDYADSAIAEQGAGRRAFIRLVAAAVVVAMTAGFAKGLVAAAGVEAGFGGLGPVSTFAVFLVSLLVCFLVNCGEPVKMIRAIYAALIMLGVVVALLSAFGLDLGYLSVGKELLWMMFTCLMAYMVFRFDFSPVRAFGLGQAAYLVASALAWGAGMAGADALASPSAQFAVSAVIALAIVAVFAFVFPDSQLRFLLTWKQLSRDGEQDAGKKPGEALAASMPSAEAAPGQGMPSAGHGQGPSDDGYVPPRDLSLHERVALIDPRFGVSAREAEIMELFAQGRSANWIAEELVISKNTVRSHLRSIYTKLDVHTRQELLDFLKTVS